MTAFLSILTRGLPPLLVLGIGWWGFGYLRREVPSEPKKPPRQQVITTRVAVPRVGQYQPIIESQGVVIAHNPVTLSAEVTGVVSEIESTFEIGAYFRAGERLLAIDDSDYQTALRVAKQNHLLATSKERLASDAHKRMVALVQRDSGSDTELDQTLATLVETTAQVEITDAAVEQAERDLARTQIKAPFDGRVVDRMVGPGQLVSMGSVLGNVFATDYAEVRLPIAASEMKHLNLPQREGDPPLEVELRDAIDSQNDSVWEASIVRTEATLDSGSLELFAIARIEDPYAIKRDGQPIRIGQPVVALIPGQTLKNVVAIPREAVRRLDQVYFIDGEERTLRGVTIDPIWSDDQFIVTKSSVVRPGELVSTSTLLYAPEGEVVQIISDDRNIDTALAGSPSVEPVP